MIRHAWLLALPLTLAGCIVGPDFKSPEAPKVAHYAGQPAANPEAEAPKLVESQSIPEQWWRLYGSEALSELVTLGLQNSPTVTAAEARLVATREQLAADTASVLFPAVDASANASRQKISGATFGNAGNARIFSLYNASLDISYTIDLFGSGQRYLELGEAKVDYEVFQLQAARLTLASNIVSTAIAEASLRGQIEAVGTIIADQGKLLAISERQFEIGVLPKAELLAQQTALAQTRNQLPALEKALAESRHMLATLTGALPAEAALPEFRLDLLTMPEEIPLALPSTLTRRRPDVRAAEALLHQASAQVGIATANLYPKISLSGSYATESSKLSDLFSAGSAIWGLGAGVTQPLFRGGELQARKRAAVAGYEQAAASYRETVLTAFRNVADALLALEMDGRQLALERQAEALAGESLQLVRGQFEQGAVSYLALLEAQRQYQQSRLGLIRAEAALYSDVAALIYALGGGWWDESPEANKMEKEL